MGVYAEFSRNLLATALARWGRGALVEAEPTALGIENCNFFVDTEDDYGARHAWVLTVMSDPPTPTTLATLELLAAARLPVPAPVADLKGHSVGNVDGHPALLSPRLPGTHPEYPGIGQCRAIGHFLALMHDITSGLDGPAHPRDLAWLETGYRTHATRMSFTTGLLLRRAIDAFASASARSDWARLPGGVVHGDLFRDNALFEGETLTGVIDFHHAARAPLAFDLAVTAMDWCSDTNGRLDSERTYALLAAYARKRPLTREECWFWPLLLTLACTRFLVARLNSPRKAPEEMAMRLADCLAHPMHLHPALLSPPG